MKKTVVSATHKFKGISNHSIDIAKASLSFDYTTRNVIEGLRFYLSEIGHPIIEDENIIKSPHLDDTCFP